MEDLVEVRQDLLGFGESQELLDILIQATRRVKHCLEARAVGGVVTNLAAYIFSRTYQWYLAGVEVRIEQEGVDEDFLEERVLRIAILTSPSGGGFELELPMMILQHHVLSLHHLKTSHA